MAKSNINSFKELEHWNFGEDSYTGFEISGNGYSLASPTWMPKKYKSRQSNSFLIEQSNRPDGRPVVSYTRNLDEIFKDLEIPYIAYLGSGHFYEPNHVWAPHPARESVVVWFLDNFLRATKAYKSQFNDGPLPVLFVESDPPLIESLKGKGASFAIRNRGKGEIGLATWFAQTSDHSVRWGPPSSSGLDENLQWPVTVSRNRRQNRNTSRETFCEIRTAELSWPDQIKFAVAMGIEEEEVLQFFAIRQIIWRRVVVYDQQKREITVEEAQEQLDIVSKRANRKLNLPDVLRVAKRLGHDDPIRGPLEKLRVIIEKNSDEWPYFKHVGKVITHVRDCGGASEMVDTASHTPIATIYGELHAPRHLSLIAEHASVSWASEYSWPLGKGHMDGYENCPIIEARRLKMTEVKMPTALHRSTLLTPILDKSLGLE